MAVHFAPHIHRHAHNTLTEPRLERRVPTKFGAAAPWPPAAKGVVAVLAILALLGAVGVFVGLTSTGDDRSAIDQQYRAEIDQLTTERSQALDDLADLEARYARATDRETELAGQITRLEATVAALTNRTDELTAMVEQVELDRDAARTARAVLAAELAAQTQRTEQAAAERDSLAALFPISFDSSLEDVDLVGKYDVKYDEAYCVGFATCGRSPRADTASISRTPEGYLMLTMPGLMSGGLFGIDGSLYTTVDSDVALAPCAGVTRIARVAVTLYAHGTTVDDDGRPSVVDLGANVAIEAPATGTCAAGMAFYGAQLTPLT